MTASMSRMAVLIYNGIGVGKRSFQQLQDAVEKCAQPSNVKAVSGPEILSGALSQDCKLICVPGGRDRRFLEVLGKEGCRLIREFVVAGGAYLGICAGSYFGADRIEFNADKPERICEERFLKFYPGVAVGPAFPGYQNGSEAGAAVAHVRTTPAVGEVAEELSVYSNGAATFHSHPPDSANITPLLYLNDGRLTAMQCEVGRGRALLCGVHIEYDPLTEPNPDDPFLRPLREALITDNAKRQQLFTKLVTDLLL